MSEKLRKSCIVRALSNLFVYYLKYLCAFQASFDSKILINFKLNMIIYLFTIDQNN